MGGATAWPGAEMFACQAEILAMGRRRKTEQRMAAPGWGGSPTAQPWPVGMFRCARAPCGRAAGHLMSWSLHNMRPFGVQGTSRDAVHRRRHHAAAGEVPTLPYPALCQSLWLVPHRWCHLVWCALLSCVLRCTVLRS